MVFSSIVFLFYFLPAVLALYYLALLARQRQTAHFVLTAVSYIFYGWANPAFVVLMLVSTLIDYSAGLAIAKQFRWGSFSKPISALTPDGPRDGTQKLALLMSITSNLMLLGYFKYFNFGMDSWNAMMHAAGFDSAAYENFLRITLPLGISFYTFQSMSYTIDVYRGHARAIRSILDFTCYVAMFPQLVAGPIIRFQEVDDQIRERTHTTEKFARGVAFIMLGLAKKVLLVDPCGKVADHCFNAASLETIDAWVGVVGYSFQIYFDFSAYSDMAIGLGLMFGFVFAKNFDSPYRSRSITEFWRRWHLSLSTWLRDYLYIPLGGNRLGASRTYINLMLVMLLGGLWHGASWNFVIWGAIHGSMLAFERLMGKNSPYSNLPAPVSTAITFVIVLITWVFFRATDLPSAMDYLAAMFGIGQTSATAGLIGGEIYKTYYIGTMLLAASVIWCGPQTWDFTRKLTWPRTFAIVGVFLLAVVMLISTSFHPFIYFIF